MEGYEDDDGGYSSCDTSSSSSCATQDAPFVRPRAAKRRAGRRPVTGAATNPPSEANPPPVAPGQQEEVEEEQLVPTSPSKTDGPSSPNKSPMKKKKKNKTSLGDHDDGKDESAEFSSKTTTKSSGGKGKVGLDAFLSPKKKKKEPRKESAANPPNGTESELAPSKETTLDSPTKAKKKEESASTTPKAATIRSPNKMKKRESKSEVSANVNSGPEAELTVPKATQQQSPTKTKKKEPKKEVTASLLNGLKSESANSRDESLESPSKTQKPKRKEKPPSVPSPIKSPTKSPAKKKKAPTADKPSSSTRKKAQVMSLSGDELPEPQRKSPEEQLLQSLDKSNKKDSLNSPSKSQKGVLFQSPSKSQKKSSPKKSASPRKSPGKKGKSPAVETLAKENVKARAAPSSFWDKPDDKIREYSKEGKDGSGKAKGVKLDLFRPDDSALSALNSSQLDKGNTSSSSIDDLFMVESSEGNSSSDGEKDEKARNKRLSASESRLNVPATYEFSGAARRRKEEAARQTLHPSKRGLSAFGSDSDDSSSSSDDNGKQKKRLHVSDSKLIDLGTGENSGEPTHKDAAGEQKLHLTKRGLSAFGSGSDDSSSDESENQKPGPLRSGQSLIPTKKKRLSAFGSSDDDEESSSSSSRDPAARLRQQSVPKEGSQQQQLPTPDDRIQPNSLAKKKRLTAFGSDDDDSSSSDEGFCRGRRKSHSEMAVKHRPGISRSCSVGSTDSEPPIPLGLRPGQVRKDQSSRSSEGLEVQPTGAVPSASRPSAPSRTYSTDSTDSEPPFSLGLRPGAPTRSYSTNSTETEGPPIPLGLRPSGPSRTYSTDSTETAGPPISLGLRPGGPPRTYSTDSTETAGPPISLGLRPGGPARSYSTDSTETTGPPISLGLRPGGLSRHFAENDNSEPPFPLSLRPGAPPKAASTDSTESWQQHSQNLRSVPPTHTTSKEITDAGPKVPHGLRPGKSNQGNNSTSEAPCPHSSRRPSRTEAADTTESWQHQSQNLRPVSAARTLPGELPDSEPPISIRLRPGQSTPQTRGESEPAFSVNLRPVVLSAESPDSEPPSSIGRRPAKAEPQTSSGSELALSVNLRSVTAESPNAEPSFLLREGLGKSTPQTSITADQAFSVNLRPVTAAPVLSTENTTSVAPISHALRPVKSTPHSTSAQATSLAERTLSSGYIPTQEEQFQAIVQHRSPLKRISSVKLKDAVTLQDRKKFLTRHEGHNVTDDMPKELEKNETEFLGENKRDIICQSNKSLNDLPVQCYAEPRECGAPAPPVVTKANFDLIIVKRPPPIRTVSKTLENIMSLQDRALILEKAYDHSENNSESNLPIDGEKPSDEECQMLNDLQIFAKEATSAVEQASIESTSTESQTHAKDSEVSGKRDQRESFFFKDLQRAAQEASMCHQASSMERAAREVQMMHEDESVSMHFEGDEINQSANLTDNASFRPQSSTKFHEIRNRLSQGKQQEQFEGKTSSFRHSSYIPQSRLQMGTGKSQQQQVETSIPTRKSHGDDSATDCSMNVEDIYDTNHVTHLSPKSRCHASLAMGPTYSNSQRSNNMLGNHSVANFASAGDESFHFAELRRIAMGAAPKYSSSNDTPNTVQPAARRRSEKAPTTALKGGRRHSSIDVGSVQAAAATGTLSPIPGAKKSVGFAATSKNDYVSANALLSPNRYSKSKVAAKVFGTAAKPRTTKSKTSVEAPHERFSKSMGAILGMDDSTNGEEEAKKATFLPKSAATGTKKTWGKKKANNDDDESVMTYDCEDMLTSFSQQRKLAMQRARGSRPKTGGLADKLKMLNLQ